MPQHSPKILASEKKIHHVGIMTIPVWGNDCVRHLLTQLSVKRRVLAEEG